MLKSASITAIRYLNLSAIVFGILELVNGDWKVLGLVAVS